MHSVGHVFNSFILCVCLACGVLNFYSSALGFVPSSNAFC